MIRFILKASTAVLACLLLSGCGTTFISGNVSTSVDPSFNANPYSRLVVMPKDLDAVYYLPVAKEALENRGFKNVSISRSNKLSPDTYDVSVLLDVGRHISEETETVKDYGVVGQDIEWGNTKCKTTNNGLTGDRIRCRTGKTEVENIYGVTGTREVTTTSLSRSISLSFTSLSNNQSVISAIGTSDVSDHRCSNAGIYKFLIIHTVKRLDFGTPRNFDYIVELPEGYDCESSLEYERSLRGGVSTGQVVSNAETYEPQTKTDNSSVTGCVHGDCVNGQGAYTYASGNKYVGYWKDGKRNGQGTVKFANGAKYVGPWKDDKRNGQGTFTWASGNKYVGQWKDDKFNGQGTFTWASGNKYVGHYEDGKRNGQGTHTWADGTKQEGQWVDDEFYGASLGDSSEDTIEQESAEAAVKAMVYEIPELGISVRDYIGSHVVAHISEGVWSKGMQSREGVIVVGVEAGGRASNLTIEKGHRIVSAWVKGSKTAVPIKDSQALKLIAEGKEPKYFKNFHVVKIENGFAEWAKLKLLFMP